MDEVQEYADSLASRASSDDRQGLGFQSLSNLPRNRAWDCGNDLLKYAKLELTCSVTKRNSHATRLGPGRLSILFRRSLTGTEDNQFLARMHKLPARVQNLVDIAEGLELIGASLVR